MIKLVLYSVNEPELAKDDHIIISKNNHGQKIFSYYLWLLH